MRTAAFVLMFCASTLSAQTLYKSVGPDGKPVYSDKPPTAGKLQKTMKVENLPNTALPPGFAAELEAMRKSGVKAAAPTESTVLFTASWCGYCRQARAYLSQARIRFEEVDVDGPAGKAAFLAAGGGGGVPLLVFKGQRIRGFSSAAYGHFLSGGK
jgi:glutaredoxin